MRVGVVGAGMSGLAAAKALTSVGHEVVAFDRAPDVGGVWSSTRHYPGLCTQNTRLTYGFSDHLPPSSWPTYPPAEQWQTHLQGYADRFGLMPSLRLGVGVELAEPVAGGCGGWSLTLDNGEHDLVDHLVVANGVFCSPRVPTWPGTDEHAAAGGVLKAPSQQLTLEDARSRHVVVVGYGKSACDVAVSLAQVAASVTVVARRLFFKGSRQRAFGVVEPEDLGQSRMSEFAFAHPKLTRGAFAVMRRETIRLQALDELGLVPPGRYEEIAQSGICMETAGFQDAVRSGLVVVLRELSIASLAGAPRPTATLDDGSVIPAELVVAATGFEQSVPFLDGSTRVQNESGEFELFRRILPHDAPNLTFCGYNTSLLSSINAEVSAVWIAAHLAGAIAVPAVEQRRTEVRAELDQMFVRTRGRHARGTSVVPFSIANLDAMVDDFAFALPRRTKAAQWVRRVRPEDYRQVLASVLESVA